MKQFVLVAGVDYEFSGVDFRQFADTRRRLLERRTGAKEDLRFTTMDVVKGEVEVREVSFATGKRVETRTSTTPFRAVSRASYATSGGHTRFKPGQWDVMGIVDVYQAVQAVGAKEPGTLVELSIFSHGWMGGPILVDSDDDRTMELQVPVPGGPARTQTVDLTGLTMRDPDDKDARPHLDFITPTTDAAALGLLRGAFTSDGVVWLWGCSFPRAIHHALWALERAREYSAVGLGDEVVLHLTAVESADVDFLDQVLVPVLGGPFPSRTSVTAKFKFLKFAFCRANQACYARALSDAAQVKVHAAPLGTYAEYDTGGDRLMNVYAGFGPHFTFYKNYLGFRFDPEGRRYAVYEPGKPSCPVPTLP